MTINKQDVIKKILHDNLGDNFKSYMVTEVLNMMGRISDSYTIEEIVSSYVRKLERINKLKK